MMVRVFPQFCQKTDRHDTTTRRVCARGAPWEPHMFLLAACLIVFQQVVDESRSIPISSSLVADALVLHSFVAVRRSFLHSLQVSIADRQGKNARQSTWGFDLASDGADRAHDFHPAGAQQRSIPFRMRVHVGSGCFSRFMFLCFLFLFFFLSSRLQNSFALICRSNFRRDEAMRWGRQQPHSPVDVDLNEIFNRAPHAR